MPQALRDYSKNGFKIFAYDNIVIILFLSLRLRPKALLPALLQVLKTNVAYALVCALGVGQVMDGGLYGKEQWSSTGA